MKIKKIVVKNLFGMFNHEIPLNTDEHITIIHGPNGYGKTILLTLIHAVFNRKLEKIRSIPLDELKIEFDDKRTLDFRQGDPIDEELKNLTDSFTVRFIETQRLLRIKEDPVNSLGPPIRAEPSMVHVVDDYSRELIETIRANLAEYGSLSQSLDRTFPKRLINGKQKQHAQATAGELKRELKELEGKRSSLIATGLLDQEEAVDFKELQKIDESKLDVLSVYIEDAKKKLSVFDELAGRIDLLLKVVNDRFLHKRLSISKKDGFVLTSTVGDRLSPMNLSSGEQHELVLLYEMLFKMSPDSLILIDEPELSLHVAWQQQFIEDLQEITKLVGFDVLIATHSPQIIHDRWDLAVELEGPKQ